MTVLVSGAKLEKWASERWAVLEAGGRGCLEAATKTLLYCPQVPSGRPSKLRKARGPQLCCDWITEALHTTFSCVLSGNTSHVRNPLKFMMATLESKDQKASNPAAALGTIGILRNRNCPRSFNMLGLDRALALQNFGNVLGNCSHATEFKALVWLAKTSWRAVH